MKKTLIALSVAAIATATTAQAKVELFANDATNVSLKGNISASVYKETKKTRGANGEVVKAKKDASINNQAKVQFDFSHKVSSDVTVGGTMEIQTGGGLDGTDNDAEFDDVALYAKTAFGKFGVGEIGDVADSNDGVNKSDITNELGGEFLIPTISDSKGKNASYSNTFGAFTATADVYTTEDHDIDNSYGVGVDYSADMFSIGAMYQSYGDNKKPADLQKDKSVWGVGASVTPVEMLTLALDYGVQAEDNKKDISYLSSSVEFKATDAATLYAVYSVSDSDNKDKEGNEYALGASYAVTDSITVFAEFSDLDYKVNTSANKNADAQKAMLGAYVNF